MKKSKNEIEFVKFDKCSKCTWGETDVFCVSCQHMCCKRCSKLCVQCEQHVCEKCYKQDLCCLQRPWGEAAELI